MWHILQHYEYPICENKLPPIVWGILIAIDNQPKHNHLPSAHRTEWCQVGSPICKLISFMPLEIFNALLPWWVYHSLLKAFTFLLRRNKWWKRAKCFATLNSLVARSQLRFGSWLESTYLCLYVLNERSRGSFSFSFSIPSHLFFIFPVALCPIFIWQVLANLFVSTFLTFVFFPPSSLM